MSKVQYVKDMSTDSIYNIKASQAIKIQPNDKLSIFVKSKNMELAVPFNTNLGGYNLISDTKVLTEENVTKSVDDGYLVDELGNIDYPILGEIKVEGLSTDEISSLISTMLKDGNYIIDAEVTVKFLNFKIMTMGTINNSILEVPSGKITLLEAIVQSGGLSVQSDAQNVKVIRENGKERKLLVANLEKYDMFNSEAYNLQQNDIVYVEQKYKQLSPGTTSVWQIVGMLMGSVSLVITSIALLKR